MSILWELQALGSLSVHINVIFGHPQSGLSFTCSTPAVLGVQPVALPVSGGQIAGQREGIHPAQGCG